MARTALFLNPGAEWGAAVDLARRADALGYDSLWVTHGVGRDAFLVLAGYAHAAPRVGLGTGIVPIYTRHPVLLAQEALTLAELTGGRLRLGLGVSHRSMMESGLGLDLGNPLEVMREYVAVLRAALGGKVAHQGPRYRVAWQTGLHRLPPAPPVLLAGLGPKMLELAGEAADGVVLSAGLSRAFMKHSLESVAAGAERAGRPLEALEIVGFVITATATAHAEAVEAARTTLAYLFRSKFIAENLRFTGTRIDLEALGEAASRRDWDTAKRHVTDEVVHAYAIAGTSEECRRRLRDYLDVGLTTPVLFPVGDERNRHLVLEIARGI